LLARYGAAALVLLRVFTKGCLFTRELQRACVFRSPHLPVESRDAGHDVGEQMARVPNESGKRRNKNIAFH
jgi:hypothetical protein